MKTARRATLKEKKKKSARLGRETSTQASEKRDEGKTRARTAKVSRENTERKPTCPGEQHASLCVCVCAYVPGALPMFNSRNVCVERFSKKCRGSSFP